MHGSRLSLGTKLICLALPFLAVLTDDHRQEIGAVLAEHRRASSAADAEAFFPTFAENAIVLGTAPDERFGLDDFRAWAAPMFTRGPRPPVDLLEEDITVAEDGELAWFVERVRRPGLGELRVSGVLRNAGERWRFVQLNHSFLVPNEIVRELAEHLLGASGNRGDSPEGTGGEEEPRTEEEQAARAVLTGLHQAAASADAQAYLGCLAEDAILFGTAAGERWTKAELGPRTISLFEQGRGWRSTPLEQNVTLAADGRHAWFDERRVREGVGELRGTGVMRRVSGAWKIVSYNCTFVLPNEALGEFVRLRDGALTADALVQRLLEGVWDPVDSGPEAVDLSPTTWPKEELVALIERNRTWGLPQPAVTGEAGMVAGTTQLPAVRAGVEALRRGGTAMDAACVTALTQIALNAGATVSYAGIMTLVYFDAETGEVHAMMAPFATPLGETSPLTIPSRGTPTGRTALVPGFMKGLESAHRRFGKLPFASLFGPAVFFAERGVLTEGPLEIWIREKTDVLSRLPATRSVFVDEEGEFAPHGELLRQPALAATLRAVATKGAAHMYTGDWARAFVEAVRADGGKVTAEDLARYEVVWSDPLRTTYRENEICTVAPPLTGGRMLLESLNLLELADPTRRGHYEESAESFYWLIQCARMPRILNELPDLTLKWLFREAEFDPEHRCSKETAQIVWERMQTPDFIRGLQGQPPLTGGDREKSGGHSDGVVAIDAAGNVVAMCHTINTVTWGTTGLFVDGVSIPDSAAFLQRRMAVAGPGSHVPNEMNPTIALAEGKPVLACSAVGRGLHEATFGCLHNVLGFGADPHAALQRPNLKTPYYLADERGRSQFYKQVVMSGRYPDELLEEVRARGQEIVELEASQTSEFRGYWIGIAIDPETSERIGAVDPSFNGAALGEE